MKPFLVEKEGGVFDGPGPGNADDVFNPPGGGNTLTTAARLNALSPGYDPEDTINVDTGQNLSNIRRGRGRPRKQPVTHSGNEADLTVFTANITDPGPSPNFEASRHKELDGLLDRGVFQVRATQMFPIGLGSLVLGSLTRLSSRELRKPLRSSRLVVKGYNDAGKQQILTQAPTIMRVSQRLILTFSLANCLGIYLRDISQAYTQSTSAMSRNVFIRSPKEMYLTPDRALRLVLP